MRIEKLNENTKKNLLDDLLKRSPNNYGKFEASVQEILNAVKEKGDEAVFEYTEKLYISDYKSRRICSKRDSSGSGRKRTD